MSGGICSSLAVNNVLKSARPHCSRNKVALPCKFVHDDLLCNLLTQRVVSDCLRRIGVQLWILLLLQMKNQRKI